MGSTRHIFGWKIGSLTLSRLALLLLLLSINVNTPNFFMTKEIFFSLLILFSWAYVDFSKIFPLLLMLTIYLVSLTYNLSVSGSYIEPDNGLKNILGMFYLFLLSYNSHVYRPAILRAYQVSSIIVALLVSTVWVITCYSEEIKTILIAYFSSIDNDNVAFVFMIRERKLLDWWFPSVYYGGAPCMLPVLGYCLAKSTYINSKMHIAIALFLSCALILTGSRANILAVFIIFFSYFSIQLYIRRGRLVALIFASVVILAVAIIALAFLGDKDEGSLEIKTLHAASYGDVFSSDIFRLFLFGWGGGSTFFTLAYNNYVDLTELSLYETIRRYGALSFILITVFIWFRPLLIIIKGNFDCRDFIMAITLLSYFFVASTNPYLLGSIGFAALLFFSVTMGRGFWHQQNIKIKC